MGDPSKPEAALICRGGLGAWQKEDPSFMDKFSVWCCVRSLTWGTRSLFILQTRKPGERLFD